jgi:hypothetical protein
MVHRRFRDLPRLTGRERLARWSAVAVAILALGFLGGLVALVSNPSGLIKGNTGGLGLVLTIPVLIELSAAVLVAVTTAAASGDSWCPARARRRARSDLRVAQT